MQVVTYKHYDKRYSRVDSKLLLLLYFFYALITR